MGAVSIVLPYDDRWYFSEVLRGAVERVEEAGHDAVVHVVPPGPTATVQAADAIEADFGASESLGAVVTGFKYRADQTERAVAWHRPIVVVGGSVSGFPNVSIDNVGAAMAVTQHLIGLGHRRVLHVAGRLHDQMDFLVDGRRARGYRSAMEGAGLEPVVVEHEFDQDAVHASAQAFLDAPDRPTAVFAVSDELAFPVIEAARELGLRIGSDLSVAGIDDHPRAEAEGLTTVRQRPAEMGAAAVDMLLGGLASGPDPKQSRLHATALVTRGSTGRRVA